MALAPAVKKPEPQKAEAAARPQLQSVPAQAGVPLYLRGAAVQRKCASCGSAQPEQPCPTCGAGGVQRSASGAAPATPGGAHEVAGKGVEHAHEPLPHAAAIQAAFGHHDVSSAKSVVGGRAAEANQQLGGNAYTVGDRVGFARDPDLHLAAHEATHVVQQRRGVQLSSGVGHEGDPYERHADAVADRVAAGQSAEALLDAQPAAENTFVAPHKAPVQRSLQLDLAVNASRLFEPEAAPVAEIGGPPPAPASGGAPPTTAPASAPPQHSADGGDSGGAPPGGGGAPAAGGGGAPAAAGGAQPGAQPAPQPAAPPAQPGAAPACDGGTSGARCYDAPSEQPANEPEQQPENPPSNDVEEQASDGDEPDAPEPDDCPAEQPGAAGAPAGAAAPAGAPGGGGGAQASPGGGGAAPAPAGGAPATSPSPAAPGEAPAAQPGGGPNAAAQPGSGPNAAAQPGSGPQAAGGGPSAAGGGGGGEAAAEGTGAEASPMDDQIAAAEARRGDAVAAYQASSGALVAASEGTATLRTGIKFSPSPDESSDKSEVREQATRRANTFFAGIADQLDAVLASARLVPDQLGAAAEAAKAQLASSIDAQKAAISSRIARARVQARGAASVARQQVTAQAASFVTDAEAKTDAAIKAVQKTHQETSEQVDQLETSELEAVNGIYAEGRTTLEGLGTKVGDECTSRGEEFANIYRGFRHCRENGFWDGDLSERRSEAQEKSAREVAKGYHDRSVDAAKKRAREVTRNGRKSDRCAVISTAKHTRQTLDEQLAQLTSALENARDTSIQQANSTRDGLIGSINHSLTQTLRQLVQQEHDQRQLVDDTGYMQQVLQEQVAHQTAASVQRGVEQATTAATDALEELQQRFFTAQPPPLDALGSALVQVESRLDAALAELHASVDGGAMGGEDQLASMVGQGLSTLASITESTDEAVTQISTGFASSMAAIGGHDNFAQQRTGYRAAMQKSAASGSAALQKAGDGMRSGCDQIKTAARKALTEAGTALEGNLRDSKRGMDCEIPRQADDAASHEPPAWKMIVAVLLIIIVIVIVIAVTILTAGMALGPLAMIGAGILIGAAVGAVTSALITIASDLWSNRALSASRIGHAALVGAITGAIGGGLGAGAGLLFKGASVAVQFASTMIVSAAIDVGTQYFMGGRSLKHFSWTSLGITLVVTALTFGLAHGVSSLRAPGGAGATSGEAAAAAGTHETVPTTEVTPTEGAPTTGAPETTPTAGPTEVAPPGAHEPPPPTGAPETPPTGTPEATPTGGPEVPAAPPEGAPAPGAHEPTPEVTPPPEAPPEVAPPPEATPEVTPPPEAEPVPELTPEQAEVLEGTASKNSDELTPSEATTEREIANETEGTPVDDPPFTTEHELPNGHEVEETPEGDMFKRCSGSCAVRNSDGELIGVEDEGAGEFGGAAQTSADVAHDVGVQQGREAAAAEGLEQAPDWVNPLENRGKYGNGFDDVLIGENGDYVVGEYKGGEADLAEGQMEREWVQDVIDRMRETGDTTWADRLQAALDGGRLTGVAYSTPIDPVTGVPGPTEVIGRWTY